MTTSQTSKATYQLVSEYLAARIQNNELDVPLLPEVASKVVRLTQDPESDASELALLIQSDQTLAGHVMRVANSAAYSPSCSMVSLQQATARLGMKLISEIALAASINSTLFHTPGFESHIQYALSYSLSSGLWAKEVSRACRSNVEAAFLAGLLHDIGKPVAIQSILKLCNEKKISLTNEEIFSLEATYQRQIGTKVAKEWKMPTSVYNVIAFFDTYDTASKEKDLTMVVVASAQIASHFMCEKGAEGCLSKDQLIAHPIFGELNLYQDETLAILEKEEKVNSAMEAMRR